MAAASTSVGAPRGYRRDAFHERVRTLLSNYLRGECVAAALEICSGFVAGPTALLALLVLCITYSPNLLQGVIASTLASLGWVLWTNISDVILTLLWRFRRLLANVLFLSELSWVIYSVSATPAGAMSLYQAVATGIAAAHVVLFMARALINGWLTRYRRRLILDQLPGLVLYSLLYARHFALDHATDWGDPHLTSAVQERLSEASYFVTNFLPGRISPGNNRTHNELIPIAESVADAMRNLPQLGTRDGKEALLTYTKDAVQKIAQEQWLQLPRSSAQPEIPDKPTGWPNWIRIALAAVLPLGIVSVSTVTGIGSTEEVRQFGYPFALAWLAISLCSAVDPNFTDRLAAVAKMRELFTQSSAKASADPEQSQRPE